jgi:RND family efflux transporter MFP subunit
MAADRRRRLTLVIVVAVILSVAGAVLLALQRHRRETAERTRLAQVADAGPEVRVARVQPGSGEREVVLPADVRAFWQTTLYAKVTGYVEDLHVDKGDRVRKGDVVARIASPETDQQVRQARSTLQIRRRIAQRIRPLAGTGAVSSQDVDQANSDLAVAEAEYQRVLALEEYEVLRAPFDGVVTARYADPGALLSGSGTGQPVVDLADPTRTRVQVYVGQDVAPFVQLGDPGEITVDQHPDVRVTASVRRIADALDPRTRSMLVELWPDESAGFRLVPGMFVHTKLRVRVPSLPWVPAEALVARGERLQVARVVDGRLHFADVEPGMNDGKTIQIRRGLQPGETVALSPPSDLGEGAPVRPVAAQPPDGGPPRQARARPQEGGHPAASERGAPDPPPPTGNGQSGGERRAADPQ